MQLAGDRLISRFNGGRTLPARSTSSISRRRSPRPLAARTENDRAREIQSLTTAAQLYEDDLLPALYDDWLTPLREDYRRRISEVLHRLATLFEEQKEYAAAIPCAERLVALDSLSESHHQLLIRLHAANHDRSSALRAYHQCMRVLRREMGVEPGPATLELFERILKAEPEQSFARAGHPGLPRRSRSRNCRKCGHWSAARSGMASVGIGLAIGGGGRSASGRDLG